MKKNKFLLSLIISLGILLVPTLSFGAQGTMFTDFRDALELTTDEDTQQEVAREFVDAALRVLKNMYGKRGVKTVAFIKNDSTVANAIRSNQEKIIKEVSQENGIAASKRIHLATDIASLVSQVKKSEVLTFIKNVLGGSIADYEGGSLYVWILTMPGLIVLKDLGMDDDVQIIAHAVHDMLLIEVDRIGYRVFKSSPLSGPYYAYIMALLKTMPKKLAQEGPLYGQLGEILSHTIFRSASFAAPESLEGAFAALHFLIEKYRPVAEDLGVQIPPIPSKESWNTTAAAGEGDSAEVVYTALKQILDPKKHASNKDAYASFKERFGSGDVTAMLWEDRELLEQVRELMKKTVQAFEAKIKKAESAAREPSGPLQTLKDKTSSLVGPLGMSWDDVVAKAGDLELDLAGMARLLGIDPKRLTGATQASVAKLVPDIKANYEKRKKQLQADIAKTKTVAMKSKLTTDLDRLEEAYFVAVQWLGRPDEEQSSPGTGIIDKAHSAARTATETISLVQSGLKGLQALKKSYQEFTQD